MSILKKVLKILSFKLRLAQSFQDCSTRTFKHVLFKLGVQREHIAILKTSKNITKRRQIYKIFWAWLRKIKLNQQNVSFENLGKVKSGKLEGTTMERKERTFVPLHHKGITWGQTVRMENKSKSIKCGKISEKYYGETWLQK